MINELTLDTEILFLRRDLKNHKLYNRLRTIDDIKLFMENHIFAVWDYMSLLKFLQVNLTTTQIPWVPSKNQKLARFINEIVLTEESDVNELGEYKSHFEMYLEAMTQIGADTNDISNFLKHIESGRSVQEVLNGLKLDNRVKEFINFSFDIIKTGQLHLVASAFTYGREDLIPDMFLRILKRVDCGNTQYTKLYYYLKRHIELDGDEHGPIAREMILELCEFNDEKWNEAMIIARKSLINRINLWDAIYDMIGADNIASIKS